MIASALSPEVRDLIELANRRAPSPEHEQPDPSWHTAISAASSDALVGLVSLLSSGQGDTSRERKALRQTATAEIERKNAKAIIETLHTFDSSTAALNTRMFWLSVADVVLAVAQVIFAIARSSVICSSDGAA